VFVVLPKLPLLDAVLRFPPLQWCPPEVCVALAGLALGQTTPVPAKTSCDVYMVGGLAYELLTCGVAPFHWLVSIPLVMLTRRARAGPVRVPGIPVPLHGLLGKNVFEAAKIDDEAIPWCMQVSALGRRAPAMEDLNGLVGDCLAAEPDMRPKLPTLLAKLDRLLEAVERPPVPVHVTREAQPDPDLLPLVELRSGFATCTVTVSVVTLDSQVMVTASEFASPASVRMFPGFK
jgi:hypothetical protein